MKTPHKIVVACDSFKGSMSSLDVALAAREGIDDILPGCRTEIMAVADGGEGTVGALITSCNGEKVELAVSDPLMRPVRACYGIINPADNLTAGKQGNRKTAVIEVAEASGLPLLTEKERNPWLASSYGTGELIMDALSRGCTDILVGLGGSATSDGGTGLLCALGYRFLDTDGNALPGNGASLSRIISIDASTVPEIVRKAHFQVACDVDAVFSGTNGAAVIFGPQKGADQIMVQTLDDGLASFAALILKETGIDVNAIPGSGAAGGLGGAFKAFLNAELMPGIEMVLETIDFDTRIADADLVITGEGRMDSQTVKGKTPFGILQHATRQGVPVIAICGKCSARELLVNAGFRSIDEISPAGLTLEQMMEPSTAKANVRNTVRRLCREIFCQRGK